MRGELLDRGSRRGWSHGGGGRGAGMAVPIVCSDPVRSDRSGWLPVRADNESAGRQVEPGLEGNVGARNGSAPVSHAAAQPIPYRRDAGGSAALRSDAAALSLFGMIRAPGHADARPGSAIGGSGGRTYRRAAPGAGAKGAAGVRTESGMHRVRKGGDKPLHPL